jgi:hypothetical protein
MRHLLFVYPHNYMYDTQDLAEEISDVLLGFSSSKNIKYTYGPKYIVIHFKTNPEYLSELEDILMVFGQQSKVDFTYFLTKAENGFRTNISPKIKNYLNDLENGDPPRYEYESIMSDNFLERLKDFTGVIEKMESELSVDEILDKISEQGMDSLTKQELNKLNNQSKNNNQI